MRLAARRDANEDQVVSALQAHGAFVKKINGSGEFDLLVGYISPSGHQHTLLLEVKDGAKPPSARRLTPAEQKFFDEWRGGLLFIVNSVDEAIAALKGIG